MMKLLVFISLLQMATGMKTIYPTECGSGYYNDEKVYEGFGTEKPTVDHVGTLTSTFLAGTDLTLSDGTKLRFSNNGVPRMVDYDGDGDIDLLVAAQGKVYLYLKQSDGKLSSGTALKTSSGDIDTGDRKGRYTGFAFADLSGDGKKDIILSKGYYQNIVYYPAGDTVYGDEVDLNIKTNYMRFDVADWDQDGVLDILVGDGNVFLFPNKGTKTSPSFSQDDKTALSPFGKRTYSRYPRFMDLNRDGKLDMVESINWGDFTLCLHGDLGRFKPIKMRAAMSEKINTRYEYGEHQAADFNDFDGDGVIDMITCGDKGIILFFKGVDTASYIPPLIENLVAKYPTDLGWALNNKDEVYNSVYDGHKHLQDLINMISTDKKTKDGVYAWYKKHTSDYPRFFKRQTWTDDEPCLAQLSGYMWNIMLETRDENDRDARVDLADATNQTGIYRDLLLDRSVFYIDNTKATSPKAEWLYQFLMKKDPALYSLSYFTHKGFFKGKNAKYSCMRDSCVNVAGYETYSWDQFLPDCQVCKEKDRSPKMTNYITIVAHEVAHNELDQDKAEAWNFPLFRRKYLLLKKAVEGHVVWNTNPEDGYNWKATQENFKAKGWWTSDKDWETSAKEHFKTGPGKDLNYNMIRGDIWFFVQSPQEAFATLSNQYFSDAKLMLDFAVERANKGYPLNIDWFLLIADYYSRESNTTPMYRIGEMYLDPTIKKYEAILERTNGFITKLTINEALPGPSVYTFEVDKDGLVQRCTTA